MVTALHTRADSNRVIKCSKTQWAEHAVCSEVLRDANELQSYMLEGNRSLERPSRRREDLHSGGWSPNWVHSARRPLTGLLYLPRVIVRMEKLVE
jgi:hypothetical protein